MKLTADKLHESIVAWANIQFVTGRKSCDILDELHKAFGFTDWEIRDELGLEHLYMDAEMNEMEEEPLKEYNFIYTESMSGTFTVHAHNEAEAWDLVEQIEFCSADLSFNDDGHFTLVD